LDQSDKPIDEELLAHARICISKLSNDFKANQQVWKRFFVNSRGILKGQGGSCSS